MAFASILCPVDFSEPARDALRLASTLAREASGRVVVAHVWDVGVLALAGESLLLTSLYQELPAAAQGQLDEWRAQAESFGAPQVTTRLLHGSPWAQVVELLEREPFDAVVVGTHGRTGLKRVVLGSVAEQIVRHAPCTAIVARPHRAR